MTNKREDVPIEFWEALTSWRPWYWRKLPMEARDSIDARTKAFAIDATQRWNGSEGSLERIWGDCQAFYWGECLREWHNRKQALKHQKRVDCGARKKTGERCKAKAVIGKNRCRFHGGLNTGPKTIEGKLKSLSCLTQYKANPILLENKRRELEATESLNTECP